MGLNIKNERTTALVRELAKRTGLSQAAAVEEAVRSKLAELDEQREDVTARRLRDVRRANARRLLDELHQSLTEGERTGLKAAEKQLYDNAGLPA